MPKFGFPYPRIRVDTSYTYPFGDPLMNTSQQVVRRQLDTINRILTILEELPPGEARNVMDHLKILIENTQKEENTEL